MKTYVIDIDGTICSNTYGEYENAIPFYDRIAVINKLYKDGNIIKFFTARGSTTNKDWSELTKKQLLDWGVNHHELIMGKPEGDFFIDDKAFNSENWNWNEIDSISEESKYQINDLLKQHLSIIQKILKDKLLKTKVQNTIDLVKHTLEKKGKVFLAGNGGSFADSQHIATEFVARFTTNRRPLPAITLGTNSSNLTAISNDFGFEEIFSREFEALANKNDFLIALSTSGDSKNIINLISKAEQMGINFCILTGSNRGVLSKYEDKCLFVPSNNTATIQQIHIILLHIIVELSEKIFI